MAAPAVDARARTTALAPAGLAVAPYAIAIALLALHVWLAAPMDGPLLSDGTGYLANARWLGGVAGEFTQGRTGFYFPGYSLVLSPVFRVVDDARAAYDGVLLVNGILASASFLVYRALARRLGLKPVPAICAGLCAALYPAVLLQASIEWSENLYHLLFAVLALLLHRYLAGGGGAVAAAGAGLSAVGLYATHPRGLGVVPVIGVALLVLARRRRDALAGVAAIVVAFVAVRLLSGMLIDALWADDRPVTEGDVLNRLTDPTLVWGTFVRSLSQLWYLLVASAGLAAAGIVWLWRRWRQPFPLIVAATMAATLAASSLMMSDGTRADHFVYGRYNEGFLPTLLVLGAAGLHELRGRRLLALATGTAIAIALLGALTVVLSGGDRFSGAVAPLNVLGILVWEQARDHIDVLRVSAGAVAVTMVVLALRSFALRAALVAAALFFTGSALIVRAEVLRPWKGPFEQLHELPDAVRALPTNADVAYATSGYMPQLGNFYQAELWDRWAGFWDESEPAPSSLVIATTEPPADGAGLVFAEAGFDQALWVLPGELHDRLAAAGFVARELVDPVVVLDGPSTLTMPAGSQREIEVRVTHPAGGAPWPSLHDDPSRAVRVVATWPDGRVSIGDLPKTLLPGQSTPVRLVLTAPADPGEVVLGIDVLQEGGPTFVGGVGVDVRVR